MIKNNEPRLTTTDRIGFAVDRVVGLLSPGREMRRRYYRAKNAASRGPRRTGWRWGKRAAQYAAAKSTRLTGTWSPVDTGVNAIIDASSASVRARVRQLVRDFPYFANAANKTVDYIVGEGIAYQARVKTPDGELDPDINQRIEDAFAFWADEADASGKMHYYEMMRLAKRQDVEAGEFLIVKRWGRRPNKLFPLSLQMYEVDWLSSQAAGAVPKSSGFEQGIEFDKITGETQAYHFVDPNAFGKAVRIPASDVIHGFDTLRPQQLRGISPFACGVLVAHDLSDYLDAELDTAKLAAKYLAFVTTPEAADRQGNVEVDDDGFATDDMENAIVEYLNPGESIEIATNPRPGRTFTPFVRLVLCMLSATTGIPYEILSSDYQGMSYATMRTSRNDFATVLRPIAKRHVRHFGMTTIRPFMDAAVMSGMLDLPNYWANPIPYLATEWQPPGMESIDPLRESKARIDEIKNGLRSPQEHAKSRGRDLEGIYREIAQAKKMAAALGLNFEEVETSTALANSPSALEKADDDDAGDRSKPLFELVKR